MTSRERLMRTLRGEPVDRPAVSFYEIGGFRVNPDDPDPFNVYNSPSWRPLLELAEEKTDLIRMCSAALSPLPGAFANRFFESESWIEDGSRFSRTTVNVAGRTLTSLTRRDPQVNTIWALEHLLKDVDDLKAYLEIPDDIFACNCDVANLVAADEEIGERGIAMVETADPICAAASLFSMEDYTVMAFTEQALFHKLLDKIARYMHPVTESVAAAFPGRLWRVCGAEYAAEPYLPPSLFDEYVSRYTGPMVRSIVKHGGFARVHCHGRIKSALPFFVEMGASAIDPIEPPPQGDVELSYVRREYGRDLVLFGNIEVSDIETLPPAEFEKVAAKAVLDGTEGEGRGFVLMPSSAPYGREITAGTMANYETLVRLASGWRP